MKWNTWCVLFIALFALPVILPAQTITISPPNPTVGVSATVQFTASVSGLSSSDVIWLDRKSVV